MPGFNVSQPTRQSATSGAGGSHARAQGKGTWADVVRNKAADNIRAPAQQAPPVPAQGPVAGNDNDENFDDTNMTIPEDLDYEAIRRQVWKVDRVIERRLKRHATEAAAVESQQALVLEHAAVLQERQAKAEKTAEEIASLRATAASLSQRQAALAAERARVQSHPPVAIGNAAADDMRLQKDRG